MASNLHHGTVVKVSAKNTSKTCHNCGYVNKDVVIGVEKWKCPICGESHNRDINAFYNFFLSQEPNIPSSYKSEFNRIKAKFENSMEHLNLYESVNSKIIFNEILNND